MKQAREVRAREAQARSETSVLKRMASGLQPASATCRSPTADAASEPEADAKGAAAAMSDEQYVTAL